VRVALGRNNRQRFYASGEERITPRSQRALEASRPPTTYDGTEINECEAEFTRVPPGKQVSNELPELCVVPGSRAGRGAPENTIEQPNHVGVKEGHPSAERDGQHGVGYVFTDARQREQVRLRARHVAPVAIDKCPPKGWQTPRAMQESERSKQLLGVSGVRLRQGVRTRIRREETVVDRLDEVGSRALEEQLGDQYRVRIFCLAPREVPPVCSKPAKHPAT
jgi:hypothetical protein